MLTKPKPARALNRDGVRSMKYISTRGGIGPVDFCDAVLMGLASDGGLLLPEVIPDVSSSRLDEWRGLSFVDLAGEVMSLYVDMPRCDLNEIILKSYKSFSHIDITPVVPVGSVNILELFHGPTLSFKDVALQFLGNLFEYILGKSGQSLNILGATSGDTGSAAICGVKGRNKIRVFIMHPYGRTSRIQELQMTTVSDENVFNIALEGDFDDCQRVLKTVFNDLDFKHEFSLGAINSINWARVLAQIVYYFFSAFRVMDSTGSKEVAFSVPTGNFGDIFAGYLATKMGLPVRKLVLATNENDILSRFFNTGVYSKGDVHATISPSMDIQVASNFERYLYYKTGSDSVKLYALMEEFEKSGRITVDCRKDEGVDELFSAGSGDTVSTLSTIREYYEKYGYILDPHTAVGVLVGEKFIENNVPMICLATAHPAKFGGAIADALGENMAHHPLIDGLEGLPSRCRILPASADVIRDYIREECS